MPIINYVTHDGNQFEADVETGKTVMQGAVDNMIDGILAECGGACSCATCHCYVDENWVQHTGIPGGIESEMLEIVPESKTTSRLSCQMVVTETMNGLVVHLPESQY